MPQFDISSLYFLFSWKYLPSWAFLLKTRKRLQDSETSQTLNFDNYYLNN